MVGTHLKERIGRIVDRALLETYAKKDITEDSDLSKIEPPIMQDFQDILEGITRDSILTIAKDLGIPTLERPIDKSELFIAEEVFLSGTAAKITPVKRVESFQLPSSRPITEKLKETLIAITENRKSSYKNWVFTIPLE